MLWEALRKRRCARLRFRRQVPIGPYFVDFFCHQARLVVEVDGQQHASNHAADDTRDRYLRGVRGLEVLRFSTAQVLGDLRGTMATTAEVGLARARAPTDRCAATSP